MWMDILMIAPVVLFLLFVAGGLGYAVYTILRDMYDAEGFFKGVVVPSVLCVLALLFFVWFATGLHYTLKKYHRSGQPAASETFQEKLR